MINKLYVNEQYIKAWIYEGVEIELDMAGLAAENIYLQQRGSDSSSEDLDYNKRRLFILQRKLELVNDKIERFSKND